MIKLYTDGNYYIANPTSGALTLISEVIVNGGETYALAAESFVQAGPDGASVAYTPDRSAVQ